MAAGRQWNLFKCPRRLPIVIFTSKAIFNSEASKNIFRKTCGRAYTKEILVRYIFEV